MAGSKRTPSSFVQWLARGDTRVVEGAHDLQRRQHPICAVIASAAAHGVDVGGHDHGGAAPRAAPPPGHVPEVVDTHLEPGLFHPPPEQVARGAIFVRQRQPGHAPAGGGSDLAQLAQTFVQAVGVDTHGVSPVGDRVFG
jgi:hypothetical protein